MNEESEKTKPPRKDPRVWGAAGAGLLAGFLIGLLIFGSPRHLPPAWGDIPTWITAIATIGLLAGAVVTAVYAIRAFRAQAQEISDQASMLRIQSDQLTEQRGINTEQMKVLGLQADELRASLAERRSAQASMVFITTETGPHPHVTQVQRNVSGGGPDFITAKVKNASGRPIYSAELIWDDGSSQLADFADRSHSERLPVVIMPGGDASATTEYGSDTRAVVLRFRDAAGVTWLRGPEGELVDMSEPTPRSARGE